MGITLFNIIPAWEEFHKVTSINLCLSKKEWDGLFIQYEITLWKSRFYQKNSYIITHGNTNSGSFFHIFYIQLYFSRITILPKTTCRRLTEKISKSDYLPKISNFCHIELPLSKANWIIAHKNTLQFAPHIWSKLVKFEVTSKINFKSEKISKNSLGASDLQNPP